jgi:hypothetical protein
VIFLYDVPVQIHRPVQIDTLVQFTTIVAVNFKEIIMGMPVRIDEQLYEQAKAHAFAERRSISGQVEFWAMVGKAALDNPDLPIDFVRDLLVARAEGPTLATKFVAQGHS